jgi:hypothetical protein
MSTREHWDEVYRSKSPDSVSWYRPRLERFLAWIDGCGLDPRAHVVDVGGGASTLVDDLLARGFECISVADISAEALRDAYIQSLRRSVRPGGFAIIATFGPNGPERCSGLSVTRHASSGIGAALGAGFELVEQADEEHTTPWGASQAFAYALCRRSAG